MLHTILLAIIHRNKHNVTHNLTHYFTHNVINNVTQPCSEGRMVRKLKHHEQKLLKKVDLVQWKKDNNLREAKVYIWLIEVNIHGCVPNGYRKLRYAM